MKRASTRFWLCASGITAILTCRIAVGQSPATGRATKPAGAHRANELTLAGLRPGRSTFAEARDLYHSAFFVQPAGGTWSTTSVCANQTMEIKAAARVISSIRIHAIGPSNYSCGKNAEWHWNTGKGLRIGNLKARVVAIYGAPDSVSPSTENGQPLELSYYAFGWAGSDVPQIMEVVCTAPKDGTPGRVVEIALGAGGL